MNYTAKLTIDGRPDDIYECLKLERIDKDRSSLEITKAKDCVNILITAKDAVALRATLDGMIKLLITFEKMIEIE